MLGDGALPATPEIGVPRFDLAADRPRTIPACLARDASAHAAPRHTAARQLLRREFSRPSSPIEDRLPGLAGSRAEARASTSASASFHAASRCPAYPASKALAAPRASSVTVSAASMRAISSIRSAAPSAVTVELVTSPATRFSTRQ